MHKILSLIAKLNNDELASPTAPEWMLLFSAGLGKLADGREYLVDQSAYNMVIEMIKARGNEIHFDYEHASQEKQPAPAAGWIKELKWEEGTGIKARVEWTQKAAAYIAAKEYRYYSPTFYIRKTDKRVCGLDSVALTNRPLTTYLKPILARLEAELEAKENQMDRLKIIAALGLPATATDEEIWAAMKPVTTTPDKTVTPLVPTEIVAALELKDSDGISAAVASIHALKQHKNQGIGTVSREEFQALQTKLVERDASDAVAAAMSMGKIAPSQKDWAVSYAKSDLVGFQLFVAKAPVVVPVGNLPGKQDHQESAAGEVTEELKAVAAAMGISIEDMKKYGMEVANG